MADNVEVDAADIGLSSSILKEKKRWREDEEGKDHLGDEKEKLKQVKKKTKT